jgi:nitrogen fixation/metabolism regulation signal transduction histidine kinase
MPEDVKQGILAKDVKDADASLVLQSLPIGVIVFDKELKIQSANPYALECLKVQTTADATFAIGTNQNIWGSWNTILLDVLNTGKMRRFDNVSYSFDGKQAILQILCSAMNSNQSGIILFENITEKANLQTEDP